MLCHRGADLAGIAVNGLLAAENDVKFLAGLFLHGTNTGGQDEASCQSIRTAKSAVTDQACLIGPYRQAFPQSTDCLGRAHRRNSDLSAYRFLQPHGHFQRIPIKRIDNAWNTVADQGVGNRINFDHSSIRNLLDANQNIHFHIAFLSFQSYCSAARYAAPTAVKYCGFSGTITCCPNLSSSNRVNPVFRAPPPVAKTVEPLKSQPFIRFIILVITAWWQPAIIAEAGSPCAIAEMASDSANTAHPVVKDAS